MPLAREIFWNVGRDALTRPGMYLLFLAALGCCLAGVRRRIRIYKLGQALCRTDNPGLRRRGLLKNVFLQSAVRRRSVAGWAHAFFFWSLVLLACGSLLIAVQLHISSPLFHATFLKGAFSRVFSLALDLAGGAALLALSVLLLRSCVAHARRHEPFPGKALPYALLYAILLSGFALEGCRVAAMQAPPQAALWEPLGYAVACGLRTWPEVWLRVAHASLWWGHLILAMGLLALLPWTVLRHTLAASANYYFFDTGPKGALPVLDLEDTRTEHYGASRVAECSWKDLLDTDACVQCGRCQEACPAHLAGTPLSPMNLVAQLGAATAADPRANLFSRITEEALWSCTTCLACQEVCPAGVEHLPKILNMRRWLVLMQGTFSSPQVRQAMERTEASGNPFGLPRAARADWAQRQGIAPLADGTDAKATETSAGTNVDATADSAADADVLFFVGCHGSYDPRLIRISQSLAALCRAAGLRPSILGAEEHCCGEPIRRTGNEYLFQLLAKDNIAAIARHGVRKIITCCPHCYHTLRTEYPEFGLRAQVQHYTQFLEELLAQGRLALRRDAFSCTYHDPCFLGRYAGLYAPPRRLIAAAGGGIEEMARSRSQSLCCGGGGGGILSGADSARRMARQRLRMAQMARTGLLLTSCPFCLTQLTDALRTENQNGKLAIRDIVEILAERVLRPGA